MMTEFANNCPYEIGDGFATIDENNPSVRWPGTTWERLDGVYPYSRLFKTTVNDLSGITWTLRYSPYTRTFPEDSETPVRYYFNFVSNNIAFKGISLVGFYYGQYWYAYEIFYINQNNVDVPIYEYSSDTQGYDDWTLGEEYRILSIIDGQDVKNPTMLDFFLTNRTSPTDFGYDYEIGETVEPGLPNITGVGHYGDNNNEFSGAFYNVKNANYIGDGSASGTLIGLDASRSNPIYGNSDTVRPRSFVANYWIRIG